MGNITIEDGDLDEDEDEIMNDDSGPRRLTRSQKQARRVPQPKYQRVLQQLADRKVNQIIIDLDDLETVSIAPMTWLSFFTFLFLLYYFMRKPGANAYGLQWERQHQADTGEQLKLVESVEINTKRYVDLFSQAIDNQMPAPSSDVTYVPIVTSRANFLLVSFLFVSLQPALALTTLLQFQG